MRRAAIAYLTLQGCAALVWWMLLLARPALRAAFRAPGAPDATLLAFALPDLVLYAGGAFASAWGLWRSRHWAGRVLCAHAGAAAYAALYCVSLAPLAGGAWWGAALMAPSAIVPPLFAWRLGAT